MDLQLNVPLLVLVAALTAGCASESTDTPESAPISQDANGTTGGDVAATPPGDPDGDDLDTQVEVSLGLDPANPDSDGDGIPDGEEVIDAESPADADGDGRIDALESDITDHDGDGIADSDDPDPGLQLTMGRFAPFAIAGDGTEETTVEIRVHGASEATSVEAHAVSFPGGPITPREVEFLRVDGTLVGDGGIRLYDDGTHGDRIAGDGLWSRGGITAAEVWTPYYGALHSVELDAVRVSLPDGDQWRAVWSGIEAGFPTFSSGRFVLGLVDPEAVGTTDDFVHTVVSPDAAVRLRRALGNQGDVPRVTQVVYPTLPAMPDFLYLFTDQQAHGVAAGVTDIVRSDIGGIGVEPFDQSEVYGGLAHAVVTLDLASNGPTLHESLHRWACFLAPKFGFQGQHWGHTSVDGQLGGFDASTLEDRGDGTFLVAPYGAFANGGDSKPYAPLELYLMGLIPADEVPAITVLRDAVVTGQEDGRFVVTASAVDTWTMDDVIAEHGPRVPAASDAPRDFTATFVLVSGRTPTPAERAFVGIRARAFGQADAGPDLLSFEAATGGRATMNTRVP